MKFGQVDHPEKIDFSLPSDHLDLKKIFSNSDSSTPFSIHVGCPQWGKKELTGFYPKGVKDELTYYSKRFNSIELNATYYNLPSISQIENWKNKTPNNFVFCPKITNAISHYKRLEGVKRLTEEFCHTISFFGNQLGPTFLQLHENFSPHEFSKLESFIMEFPQSFPLAVEVRHPEWFSNSSYTDQLFELLESQKRIATLIDTAGRRDVLHMRASTSTLFIRFVGANHPSDYKRLTDWIFKIKEWKAQGLKKVYFFIHQNVEVEIPQLITHFVSGLNKEIGTRLPIPIQQQSLF